MCHNHRPINLPGLNLKGNKVVLALRFSIFLLLAITLLFAFPQMRKAVPSEFIHLYSQADSIYTEAEKTNLTEEKETELNKLALEKFRDLMMKMGKENYVNDSLAFHSFFRIGVLEHYFENLPAAQDAYQRAIDLYPGIPFLPDSFLFKPYLYLGIVLYNGMQFDSALAVYKKAEIISDKYGSSLAETERMLNTMGALYYQTGNYRQAKNYMEKSVIMLSPSNPYYRELFVNYKINLASTLTKLEEFDEANRIYESLLPYGIHRDIILHNTGIINLNLGAIEKALRYFRQVDVKQTNRMRLYTDMAVAHYNLRNYDSAHFFLNEAIASGTASAKSIAYGQTMKIRGDVLLAENKIHEAINSYQRAIIQFYRDFNEPDIYKDPETYSGVFSYINLFNALSAKAIAFEEFYARTKRLDDLTASLNAYKSAFRLADYVEKSYDSDEARLFLNKIKYVVHNRPINVSIALYEMTRDGKFLEDAYFFDQVNKGSVISLSIHENELKRQSADQSGDIREETNLRSSITRLSLKAAQLTDSVELEAINASIRDIEIRLGKLQERISQAASDKNLPVRKIPSIKEVQERLDKKTSFLSYHLSEKELVIFFISGDETTYKKIPINDSFILSIESYHSLLRDFTQTPKDKIAELSSRIFDWVIAPVYDLVKDSERLIIIPDDELNYLPFETLLAPEKKYLVELFSIQYQYSAAMLNTAHISMKRHETLSVAPFSVSAGYGARQDVYNKLNYSGEEISKLKGKILLDSKATKRNFLEQTNKFPVVHLATHAEVNDKDPLRSYIAFYPERDNTEDFKLYAAEIYNLKLDSTNLVILSACETGTGELVRGEGLMSLSRAFAYAGCPNIVTSLWKANDKSTAFIASRFHYYFSKDLPPDIALQKAKLDLLSDKNLDPRLKSPNYWGHLLFIGNYEPRKSNLLWLWIGLGAGFIFILLLFYYRGIPYSSNFREKIKWTIPLL